MKITRILHTETNPEVLALCKHVAGIRADLWRRYGALGTHGRSAGDIRKVAVSLYSALPIDGTIRNETCKDILNDIYTYRAASEAKVRQAVFKRTTDATERKRLFTLLKRGEWLSDPFLHRQMRKHFRHGVAKCTNQFVVRSDRVQTMMVDGKLCIQIAIASKYGKPIVLTTNSTGRNVNLSNSNLRIIAKCDAVEIHYCTEKTAGRAAGLQAEIGVDKGYTEALVDSNGNKHGTDYGKVMTAYTDKVHKTGQSRGKLHAIEKKHRAAGRIAKADRIKANNLGTIKLNARRELTQKNVRQIAFKAAHAVVDIAGTVAAEDLTSVIANRSPQWKKFNRRMSAWAKGSLAEALESVTKQRGAKLVLVCAAYTSQIDSQTGLLEGRRVGDQFYHKSGDVGHADINAARNVLARLRDPDIGRFTPFKSVRTILLARSSGATERHGGLVGQPPQQAAEKLSDFTCASLVKL